MTQGRAIRLLRGAGFAMGTIAAVVVFVVGARNGVQDWTVPALLLVGILMFVLHVATLAFATEGDEQTTTRQIVEYEVVPQGFGAPTGPATGFEPTAAPGLVAATVPGLGAMAIQEPPPGSFPDAGNSHDKRYTVTEAGPPPLHEVLVETPGPVAAPADFEEDSDDSVFLDIRPQRDDEPMVQRMLHGEPPPEDATADVSAPAVHTESAAEPSSLPGPTGPRLAGPSSAPAPGWWMASDGNWYPPELHPDATSRGQG